MSRLLALLATLALVGCAEPRSDYTFEPGTYDPDRVVGLADLDRRAAAGDTAAQFQVALLRHTMAGRYDAARPTFERLAADGHRPSMEMLAMFAADGRGEPVDYERAAMWYARAAARGSARAARALAAYRAHRTGAPGSAPSPADS